MLWESSTQIAETITESVIFAIKYLNWLTALIQQYIQSIYYTKTV